MSGDRHVLAVHCECGVVMNLDVGERGDPQPIACPGNCGAVYPIIAKLVSFKPAPEPPEPTTTERRATLNATVSDLVADLLFYGRKEDEDLPSGAIEEMIESGAVTTGEIVEWFREELEAHC